MNSLLADLLKYFTSLIVITATIGYVVKTIFDKFLDSRIEKYKGDLNLELETHKSKLTTVQIEHQIRYAKLYEERGVQVKVLYDMLYELEKRLIRLTSVFQGQGWEDDIERENSVREYLNELDDALELNRIYFSDDLYSKIDKIKYHSSKAVSDMSKAKLLSQESKRSGHSIIHEGKDYLHHWREAEQRALVEIKNARHDLANELKALLGVSN